MLASCVLSSWLSDYRLWLSCKLELELSVIGYHHCLLQRFRPNILRVGQRFMHQYLEIDNFRIWQNDNICQLPELRYDLYHLKCIRLPGTRLLMFIAYLDMYAEYQIKALVAAGTFVVMVWKSAFAILNESTIVAESIKNWTTWVTSADHQTDLQKMCLEMNQIDKKAPPGGPMSNRWVIYEWTLKCGFCNECINSANPK